MALNAKRRFKRIPRSVKSSFYILLLCKYNIIRVLCESYCVALLEGVLSEIKWKRRRSDKTLLWVSRSKDDNPRKGVLADLVRPQRCPYFMINRYNGVLHASST